MKRKTNRTLFLFSTSFLLLQIFFMLEPKIMHSGGNASHAELIYRVYTRSRRIKIQIPLGLYYSQETTDRKFIIRQNRIQVFDGVECHNAVLKNGLNGIYFRY